MMSLFSHRRVLSEINVTPFVDVMLVLLVIFMVTAPLIQHGINVDLPKVSAQSLDKTQDELMVSIDREGRIYILDHLYSLEVFSQKMALIHHQTPEKKVFLAGDRDVPYERVTQTMAAIRNAGFAEVGLITEPISKEAHP